MAAISAHWPPTADTMRLIESLMANAAVSRFSQWSGATTSPPPCADNIRQIGSDARAARRRGREPLDQFAPPHGKLARSIHHASGLAAVPDGGTTNFPAVKREFAQCLDQASLFS